MKNKTQGGHLIAKIKQLSARIFNRLLKKNNIQINTAQGRILFVLWKNDQIPIRELVKQTQLSKSSLTSMLERLEKKGLIKRTYSKGDKRETIIERTQKDYTFRDEYIKVSNEMNDIFYRDFTEKDIEKFENYLKKILDNLMNHKLNG